MFTKTCCFSRPYTITVALFVQCYVRRRLSFVACRLCEMNVLWPAERCVLEQKLLLTAYRKLYMRNRLIPNEWPWLLFRGRIKVMSCNHCVTFDVEYLGEAWFQRTTNRKWHMGYQMVTWSMTSRDLERSNSWPPIRLERNISTTAGDKNFVPKDHQ